MSDLSRELREAAEKATPGPWTCEPRGWVDGSCTIRLGPNDYLAFAHHSEANATYIALCSPDRILSLLDKADAAEGLAEAGQALDDLLPTISAFHTDAEFHAAAYVFHEALARFRAQEAETDPTEGLPPDLKRILRDQSVIVPQDQAVFEQIAKWAKAPSDTASGHIPPVDERESE